MSERKVLNKYYPPDFDPAKVPKLKQAKNRQFSIRTMAPFNMRCKTCGEYIYKGKKFNSRSEMVLDEDYLGLRIYRFYIRCPKCVTEITWKTDPVNCDYALEDGAIRNFEAFRTAQIIEEKKIQDAKDEEDNNPMLALENRTKASRNEIEALETLEELRDQNSKHAKVDVNNMIEKYRIYEQELARLQEEEDEKFVNSLFGKGEDNIKRLHDSDSSDEDEIKAKVKKITNVEKPTDVFSETKVEPKKVESWQKSVGTLKKSSLANLVKKKPLVKTSSAKSSTVTSEQHNDKTFKVPTAKSSAVTSHVPKHKSSGTSKCTENEMKSQTPDFTANNTVAKEPSDATKIANEAIVPAKSPKGSIAVVKPQDQPNKTAAIGGLAMLDYSDSDESE